MREIKQHNEATPIDVLLLAIWRKFAPKKRLRFQPQTGFKHFCFLKEREGFDFFTVYLNSMYDNIILLYYCIWLRRCATSRTVPGSIPGVVTGFFSDIFASDQTMALGSTQPLPPGIFLGGKAAGA